MKLYAEPKHSILFIDDDASMAELVQLTLESSGYHFIWAKNGSEAIDRLKSIAAPSLIILDMAMPVMNGSEVLDQMRMGGYLDKIPVIVVSAQTSVHEMSEVCEVLAKPLSMDHLMLSVEKVIQKFSQRAASKPPRRFLGLFSA